MAGACSIGDGPENRTKNGTKKTTVESSDRCTQRTAGERGEAEGGLKVDGMGEVEIREREGKLRWAGCT